VVITVVQVMGYEFGNGHRPLRQDGARVDAGLVLGWKRLDVPSLPAADLFGAEHSAFARSSFLFAN
jgi:hypothetical protein